MSRKETFRKVFRLPEPGQLSGQFKDDFLKGILSEVRQKRRTHRIRMLWSSAAAILLLGGLSVLYRWDSVSHTAIDLASIAKENESLFETHEYIQFASRDASDNNLSFTALADSDSAQLVALDESRHANSGRSTRYATLYVPYGKRQEFKLPDGSLAWLNAGSFLTYADDLGTTGTREVYLNGEGYFDISHTGSPFVVRTKHAHVRVLGTTFNLMAYEEEKYTAVELLTGKIAFDSPDQTFKTIELAPGQRIHLDVDRRQISLNKSSSGYDILWTKKQIALEHIDFGSLMRRLERVYNVSIKADPSLYDSKVKYSGRINIGVDVITSLSNIYELNNYDFILKDKEVHINRKK